MLDNSFALTDRAATARQEAIGLREQAAATRMQSARLHADCVDTARIVARDRRITETMTLAGQIARRFSGRGQSYEDLYQVACLGLVKAAERFDEERGVQFRTYAQAVMTGEIKRYFRDHAWGMRVARPVQEMYLLVREARERMTQLRGRAPTVSELSAELHCTEEDVIEAIQAGDTFHLQSTDAPAAGDEAPPMSIGTVDGGYQRIEERSWLVPAIKTLSDRDRAILEMRFFEGLSQSQIAARVGLSQMHVSRLLARSLAVLRAASPDLQDADVRPARMTG